MEEEEGGSAFEISIHALRKESDELRQAFVDDFGLFQSTLSVRRATTVTGTATYVNPFQSTLSVRRATRPCPAPLRSYCYFNPRSP